MLVRRQTTPVGWSEAISDRNLGRNNFEFTTEKQNNSIVISDRNNFQLNDYITAMQATNMILNEKPNYTVPSESDDSVLVTAFPMQQRKPAKTKVSSSIIMFMPLFFRFHVNVEVHWGVNSIKKKKSTKINFSGETSEIPLSIYFNCFKISWTAASNWGYLACNRSLKVVFM